MRVEKRFVIAAPAGEVFAFLTDPARVAQCLPGAALTGQVDERTWEGTITVKVGPVSSSYRGRATFELVDATARRAEVVASGQDVRGKGGADLRLSSEVIARGPRESEVVAAQEIGVTGMLAQLGRGMIEDVGDQMFEKFVAAMRAQLEGGTAGQVDGGTEGAPVQLLTVGGGAAARAAGRTARNPVVWIVVAVVAIALWLMLR